MNPDRLRHTRPRPTSLPRAGSPASKKARFNPNDRPPGLDAILPNPLQSGSSSELHPCVRVYGYCAYGERCKFAREPRDSCLLCLKGKSHLSCDYGSRTSRVPPPPSNIGTLPPGDPLKWTEDDVAKWLVSIDFSKEAELFKTNKVDGKVLLALDDDEVERELQITGIRKKRLMMEIENLQVDMGRASHAPSSSALDPIDMESAPRTFRSVRAMEQWVRQCIGDFEKDPANAMDTFRRKKGTSQWRNVTSKQAPPSELVSAVFDLVAGPMTQCESAVTWSQDTYESLSMLHGSAYLTPSAIRDYVSGGTSRSSAATDVPQKLERIVKVLLVFEAMLRRFRRCAGELPLEYLEVTLNEISAFTSQPCPQEVLKLFQSVKVRRDDELRLNQVFARQHKVGKSHGTSATSAITGDVTTTYRDTRVFPSIEEIRGPDPLLRKNAIDLPIASFEIHLDTHFHLLREDFLRTLRTGLRDHLEGLQDRPNRNFRIYHGVCIVGLSTSANGIVYRVKFEVNSNRIQWDKTKRLQHGALVCLSHHKDNFTGKLMWATIARRTTEELKQQMICLRFPNAFEHDFQIGEVYDMAETSVYFEAFQHNLHALQHIDVQAFPFQKYLLGRCTEVDPPAYLLGKASADFYDFEFLRPKVSGEPMEEDHDPKEASEVKDIPLSWRVLQKWPEGNATSLDDSQLAALKLCLTKELALVQGPPGTGKTFLGVQFVHALLKNSTARTPQPHLPDDHPVDGAGDPGAQDQHEFPVRRRFFNRRFGLPNHFPRPNPDERDHSPERQERTTPAPILVVCYTNHALDQFLEEVLKFGDKVVRIGGRASPALEAINLWKMETPFGHPGEGWRYREICQRRNELEANITKTCHQLNQTYLSFDDLLRFCTPEQAKFLRRKRGFYVDQYRALSKEIDFQKRTRFDLEERIREVNDFVRSHPNLLPRELFPLESHLVGLNSQLQALQRSMEENERELQEAEFREENVVEAWIKESAEPPSRAPNLPQHAPLALNPAVQNVDDDADDDLDDEDERVNNERILDDAGDLGMEFSEIRPGPRQEASLTAAELTSLNTVDADRMSTLTKAQCIGIHAKWRERFQNERTAKIQKWCDEYEALTREKKGIDENRDLRKLRSAAVVGVTTTGAAKYLHLLRMLACEVVVVEEAAEVLEAHVLTALSNSTKHLVLIGDHKQLRPKVVSFDMEKLNLGVSLFERLINLGLPHVTLAVQRRMRPEIFALTARLYPPLQCHSDVKNYPNVKGMAVNHHFFTHKQPEQEDPDLQSPRNPFEAKWVVLLAEYLILQGYSSSEITIIVPYIGQLKLVRHEVRAKTLSNQQLENIRVASVDNFQGEENLIIILSLVRSNENDKAGFLKVAHRACVALSRAKHGLYVVGNFELIERCSDFWRDVCQHMRQLDLLSDVLSVKCQHHRQVTPLRHLLDFKLVADGGCTELCNIRLNCGHICRRRCHPDDFQEHKLFKCRDPCVRRGKDCLPVPRSCSHQCTKDCCEECGPCEVLVDRRLPCGHTQFVHCSQIRDKVFCQAACQRMLPCGHRCPLKCGEPCLTKCKVKVLKLIVRCGHFVSMECSTDPATFKCIKPCRTLLPCEHACTGTCGTCSPDALGRVLHRACRKACKRVLVCGHQCENFCAATCPPCTAKCENVCAHHSKCQKTCGEACPPCNLPCDWKCEHLKCELLCHQPCQRLPCNHRCPKKCINKKHQCPGLCGEVCPTFCRDCDPKSGPELNLGREDEPDALFIQLACGHAFEYRDMDMLMGVRKGSQEDPVIDQTASPAAENTISEATAHQIQLKRCPTCSTVIRTCNRYNSLIKQTLLDMAKVKALTFARHQKLLEAVQGLKDDLEKQLRKAVGAEPGSELDMRSLSEAYFPRKFQLRRFFDLKFLWECVKNRAECAITAEWFDPLRLKADHLANLHAFRDHLLARVPDFPDSTEAPEVAEARGALSKLDELLDSLTSTTATRLAVIRIIYDVTLLRITTDYRLANLKAQAQRSPASVMERLKNVETLLSQAVSHELSPTELNHLEAAIHAICKLIDAPLSPQELREIHQALAMPAGHWFKCPNGHFFTIGGCGGAMEVAKCNECQAGGSTHTGEIDCSRHAAWSETANQMLGFGL